MSAGTKRTLRLGALAGLLLAGGALLERHEALGPLRLAIQRDPRELPSARLAPRAEVASGLAVVSLAVADEDLHDPGHGILTHRLDHGREWERPGTVSYFEGGRLRFSAAAGVRVHGGSSREGIPEPGFRLYFRRQYGARGIPGELLYGPGHRHPVKRLILHNDRRPSRRIWWHLVNPLAYDIAGAAGALTAATRPARVFLNGRLLGVYVLTEHFHERHWFEDHLGHAVRLDGAEFYQMADEVLATTPLRMRTLSPLLDIENLTRWFIAVVFCATEDAYQGPGQYRDPSREAAQWFWVNWDMDGSFRNPTQDTFAALLSRIGEARRARRPSDVRPLILTTLLAEDPEYREYFKRIWVDVMNHRLTRRFLDDRLEYYRRVALQYGIEAREYRPRVEDFIRRRRRIVRELAEQWLNTPPSVRCRLTGRGTVLLDGRPIEAGFEGFYFPGMTISLSVPDDARRRLAGWRVNGRQLPVGSGPLQVPALADLEIEAIWR